MIAHKLFIPLPFLHPLFYITLAFILGIYSEANIYSLTFCFFLGLSLSLFAYATAHSYVNLYKLTLSIFLSLLAGKYNFYNQQQNFYNWINSIKKPVNIIVTVTDIIPCAAKNYKFITYARIEKIYDIDFHDKTLQKAPSSYFLIYTKEPPTLLIQDRIFLSSVKISNPSKESWYYYALKHNIGGTFFCQKLNYSLITRPYWSWRRWSWYTRQQLFERLLKKMSDNTALFYALLFMGSHYKHKEFNTSLRDTFQIWGILHYLARSGLHLVVFLMIWNTAFLLIPCSYRVREGLLLLLSFIYFILSWPSLSFVRAFTTYVLYKITSLCSRPANTLHTIVIIILFFLIINPIYLFCLDFQLSFGLTFALGWFQNNNIIWKNITLNS